MSKEHVIQRAKERLNLNLTEWDCEILSKMIQDGECEPLHDTIFAIHYKNRIFKVAYSKKKHAVTTIMKID
jgi:hypothetical protein